jgi:hypothetical protein
MDLISISNRIQELLTDYEVKDLPNTPNLNGVFEQTDITYAIVSGQRNSDTPASIIININVSIAAIFRVENQIDEQKSLYGLMRGVTFKLHKQKVPNGKLLKLLSFENFTPESGKWRTLLTFDVQVDIENEKDENDDCLEGLQYDSGINI